MYNKEKLLGSQSISDCGTDLLSKGHLVYGNTGQNLTLLSIAANHSGGIQFLETF